MTSISIWTNHRLFFRGAPELIEKLEGHPQRSGEAMHRLVVQAGLTKVDTESPVSSATGLTLSANWSSRELSSQARAVSRSPVCRWS